MTILDIVILVILGLFTLSGLRYGLVRKVGSLIGLIIGVVIAGSYYEIIGTWLAALVFTNELVARVVAFVLILIIVNRLFDVAVAILDKIVKFVSIIPGIASINKLAGGIVGLIEGVLFVGVILYFASRFDLGPGWKDALSTSQAAPWLLGIAQIIVPLLPGAVKSLQSVL